MNQDKTTSWVEVTRWARSCPICGRLLYKDAEEVDKPIPCPCGKWTWD